MRFELAVAIRYLKAKRKQTLLSIVSFVAILGFVLGVMALIIALALMTGFQEDIQTKILGASAHVMIYPAATRGLPSASSIMDIVRKEPYVVSLSPVVYGKVMVYSAVGSNGIIIKGINPETERNVTELTASIPPAALHALNGNGSEARDAIILGSDLAESLRAHTDDLVTIVSPESMLSPLGLMPTFKKFRVVGTFHSGLYEFDNNWALVSMKAAQRLFSLGSNVTLVEARIKDLYKAQEVTNDLQHKLGARYIVDNWINQNKSLFSAMKLEKLMLFITIALIVLVAAFNIISTLVMMVLEKNKDIAVLMAMGCTSRQIMRIFMLQGVLLGIVGTILGAVLGVSISWVMDHYRVISLPLDVYYIPYLPFHIRSVDFILVTATALLISFISTLYPALRASKINPAEALRYE